MSSRTNLKSQLVPSSIDYPKGCAGWENDWWLGVKLSAVRPVQQERIGAMRFVPVESESPKFFPNLI